MDKGRGVKGVPVGIGELADEGRNGKIGKGRPGAKQVFANRQTAIKPVEDFFGIAAMFGRIGILVAVEIFIAVEMMFERTVILRNQGEHVFKRAAFGLQPFFRVIFGQCPDHDFKAFVDHGAIGQDQDGHGGLGGGIDHGLRFVAQHDFAQFDIGAAGQQGHAGAHRIGAATETV